MRFLVSMNLCSKLFDKLYLFLSFCVIYSMKKPNFIGIVNCQTVFQQFKISIPKDVTLIFDNTYHPLFSTVYYSLIDIDSVLLQLKDRGNWLLFHAKLVILQLMNKNSVLVIVNCMFNNNKQKYWL